MSTRPRLRKLYPLAPSTPSLLRHEPLLDDAPAPTGTAFVLGEGGGFAAVAAPANRLVLGRNSLDVHVTVGAGDWYISREHATLTCTGDPARATWRLRNHGRLPIRVPDAPELLHEHEMVLPAGYTPLYLRGERRHVIEVLITARPAPETPTRSQTATREMGWPLTDRERLVLVAVFQSYLLRAEDAHPLSWRDASQVLNDVPGESGWTERKAEHVVDIVRHAIAKAGRAAVTAETAHPDAIKRNLLAFLLSTATLAPPDLRLLERPRPDRDPKHSKERA